MWNHYLIHVFGRQKLSDIALFVRLTTSRVKLVQFQSLNGNISQIPGYDGVLDNNVALWKIVLDVDGKTLCDMMFHLRGFELILSGKCRVYLSK